MDFEIDGIVQELGGHLYRGKLRIRENDISFKNEHTGKVDHLSRSELFSASWLNRAAGNGLMLKMKNQSIYWYDGFGDLDSEKVTRHFQKYYNMDINKQEMSYKGFNWGDVECDGEVLNFACKNALSFQIPMRRISNATANKNEIALEFHLNDDAEICLAEMRMHTPATEADREGKAAEIYAKVTEKADIIQVTGDSLIEFKEIQCLQPRGRYDMKLYPTFISLHGKTFDFKVPRSTIVKLFMLPHPDSRQIYFLIQLDPPIKHGQTRYHFTVIQFDRNSHVNVELTADEDWLQEQFHGKLQKELSGYEYEVIAKIFRVLFDRKVTSPGEFKASGGSCAVVCNYKASGGHLYPLERAFIFVPKPVIFIRFEEISSVNFSRGTGSLKSFDFDVETRNGITHTFTAIDRIEYEALYNFVSSKKMRVKNIASSGGPEIGSSKGTANQDWSSEEDESSEDDQVPIKSRTEQRKPPVGGTGDPANDDSDESDDEDFKPPDESDDDDLEYDSQVETTPSGSSSSSGDSSGDETGDKEPVAKKTKRPPKSSSSSTSKKTSSSKQPQQQSQSNFKSEEFVATSSSDNDSD